MFLFPPKEDTQCFQCRAICVPYTCWTSPILSAWEWRHFFHYRSLSHCIWPNALSQYTWIPCTYSESSTSLVSALRVFLEVLLQRSIYLQGDLSSRVAVWGIEFIFSLEAPSSLSWSTFFLESYNSQTEPHLSAFKAGVSCPRRDTHLIANMKGRGKDLCCYKNITLAVDLSSMYGCTDMLHGWGQPPFTATP